MVAEGNVEDAEKPPRLGGGPLGLDTSENVLPGDPDDLRLRKTERDIILPKLIREEAGKKCPETMKAFADCARSTGLLVPFKCQKAKDANNDCILSWAKNPEFVKEVTDKYLENRSHYRRTGVAVEKYQRHKSKSPSMC